MKPSEPTLNFYNNIEGRQCSAGIVETEIAVFTEALGREWYDVRYNVGDYCHFPSFGKGWFDQIMDNGDHVQMGVECDNDWNYEDHSIAKKGEKCRLICKNLSGTGNVYKPIDEKRAHFKCRSPIPLFAFHNRKCHKNMVKFIIRDVYSYYEYRDDSFSDEQSNEKTLDTRGRKYFYNECYKDWVKKGLNMGISTGYECSTAREWGWEEQDLCPAAPWFFDLQTEDWPTLYGESYNYYGDEGGSGLTIIRENHHSCQLAESTV